MLSSDGCHGSIRVERRWQIFKWTPNQIPQDKATMGIHYESQVFGDIRAIAINGQQGLGASQLRFVLAWNLFPKRTDVFTVFGTSIWISVTAEGEGSPLLIGQAMPETAWCEESRDGEPFDRHVMYRLNIADSQLLALEELRRGRGLVFTLDVRGNSHGSHGIRTFNETIQLPVNVSEWVRVLKEANGAEVLLVGVHLPVDGADNGKRAAIDLVRRANEHLVLGHYSVAIAECRRAIESLWKSANLTDKAREAKKLLATMSGQLSMTKRNRELALAEALKNFCNVGHHVGDNGEPEIFSRTDAALAVATTASLVSSLLADPELLQSSDTSEVGRRTESIVPATAEPPKQQDVPSLADQVIKVRGHIENNQKNLPGTMKKLRSALDSLFGKKLGAARLDKLTEELVKSKVVAEVAGKLSYPTRKK
jgi:hypothetical protein